MAQPTTVNLETISPNPTGEWAFEGGKFHLPETTVASLPAAGTSGRIYIVTDTHGTLCASSGGGTTRLICRDTGAAWEAIGSSGGGGGTECSSASCDLNVNTTLNTQGICLANGTNCPGISTATPTVTPTPTPTVSPTAVACAANFVDAVVGPGSDAAATCKPIVTPVYYATATATPTQTWNGVTATPTATPTPTYTVPWATPTVVATSCDLGVDSASNFTCLTVTPTATPTPTVSPTAVRCAANFVDAVIGPGSDAAATCVPVQTPVYYATPTAVPTPGSDPALAAGQAYWANGFQGIISEGATADTFEGWLAFPDWTADRTITFPNETGTVCTSASVCTGYMGTATVLGTSQNSSIHGNDNVQRFYGTDSDWSVQYDETTNDALIWGANANGSAATTTPMYGILGDFDTANGTNITANQMIFGVGKGTLAAPDWVATVDEDGDVTIDGTLTGAVASSTLTIGGVSATADARSFLVTTAHAPSVSATNWHWGSQSSAFEVNVNAPVPQAGTLSRLYCSTNGAPGSAKSYAITVRKNAADCGSFSCSLTGTSNPNSCNDTSATCTVAAGDLIAIQSVPSGTPAAITLKCSLMLEVTDG